MEQTKGYTMNNEEKIIVKESALDEVEELIEDFVSELKLDEKNYHVFMAVLRNRLDFHAGRIIELGVTWNQIDEV
tara:strand:- start:2458 stop:2682 length:225 start_codon:yes stop_codon:yes gene_type:complete